MKIARARVYRYTLPLRQPLLLAGRPLTARSGLLLRLCSEEGMDGWGEAAPLPGFSRESAEQAQEALVACARALGGHPLPDDFCQLQTQGLVEPLQCASVSFAAETAVLNLRAAMAGRPLSRTLVAQAPRTVSVNALLSGTPDKVLDKARGLASQGYRAAKLKVGQRQLGAEIGCVQQVRAALGAELALRLDANRAWHLDTALAFGRGVQDCGIDYIEEPVQDPHDLEAFLDETGIPYALDETLQRKNELAREKLYAVCARARAAVLKPTLLHSPGMLAMMLQAGLPCEQIVVSAAFESGVGIAALAQYAAVLSGADIPAGLDTYGWLAEDVLEERLPVGTGVLELDAIDRLARGVAMDRLDTVWDGD